MSIYPNQQWLTTKKKKKKKKEREERDNKGHLKGW
jgi:hypothetical protein